MPAKKLNCREIIFIVGPTAVGKSEAAAVLAKKVNAEVISCDSMQVYKGMGIITSSPGARLTKYARHHLTGVVPPSRDYNVSSFRRDALKKLSGIIKRGKSAVFVGGSGLYMSILLDGIFEAGAQDFKLREKLYKMAEKKGASHLHSQLKRVDPEAAAKIHPNDAKRVIRALEVFKVTGKPISALQKERRGLRDGYKVQVFCLNMPKPALYRRIDERVEKMFRQGLVAQVRSLLKRPFGRTASFAIGISEVSGYLRGECSLQEAKEKMKLNTRRYAKRQLTWFRKDKSIKWIGAGSCQGPQEVAQKIFRRLKN